MSDCPIQLRHPHGPISIIIEYLPEIEQMLMQGVNKNFYDKIIPALLEKVSIPRTFFFANNFYLQTGLIGVEFLYVTKNG